MSRLLARAGGERFGAVGPPALEEKKL